MQRNRWKLFHYFSLQLHQLPGKSRQKRRQIPLFVIAFGIPPALATRTFAILVHPELSPTSDGNLICELPSLAPVTQLPRRRQLHCNNVSFLSISSFDEIALRFSTFSAPGCQVRQEFRSIGIKELQGQRECVSSTPA
jgi:hypothetical protein